MRVRRLVGSRKTVVSDTGAWSTSDLPPRHAPIFVKTRPTTGGWRWRSARLMSDESEFVMFALCNPSKDNWKAMLIKTTNGPSVVSRFEFHGSHPGLHVHAHCDRGGIEIGATSINNLARIPRQDRPHRRTAGWTEATFWNAAMAFFNARPDEGPLFRYAAR